MYFWRIEKLKTEMTAGSLSEREMLPYLLVFIGCFTAVGYIPQTVADIWDGLAVVWSVALAILGTIYIYRQNGGAEGQHFLQRYLVIGWVVSVRCFVVVAFTATAFFSLLVMLEGKVEETTLRWGEFVFIAGAEAAVYWKIGYHVRDLARRTGRS